MGILKCTFKVAKKFYKFFKLYKIQLAKKSAQA